MFESIVRQFLYHPTRLATEAPLPSYARDAEERFFNSDDGARLHALHWPATPGRPTILFFHGNAQSVFEWALIREDFLPLECGLLLVDYPGYGKSTGSPSEASLYACGHAALKFAEQSLHLSDNYLILFGKSLGGGVVCEIAQQRAFKAVVLESTFTSIPAVARNLIPILPADAMLRTERYDSIEKIGAFKSPVLVIHGEKDNLIPVSEGKKLFVRASSPKSLYLAENAGHNDVSMMEGTRYGQTIREWLDGLEEK